MIVNISIFRGKYFSKDCFRLLMDIVLLFFMNTNIYMLQQICLRIKILDLTEILGKI